MEYLVAFLINWLSLTQGLHIENAPKIKQLSSEQLEQLFKAPALALYSHTSKVIFIDKDIDLGSVFGYSVVLHELIHHYQNESGLMKTYPCIQAGERLAYNIQRKFLIYNGVDIDTVPEMDQFNIFSRSLCPSFMWGEE